MHISIREVDKSVFRRFRSEAVREGLNVGAAMTLAMKCWLDGRNVHKKKLSLLDFKPKDWGPGTENTSREVDKILYGD